MVLYSCVLIVLLLCRELLKLILVNEPVSEVVLSHQPLESDSYILILRLRVLYELLGKEKSRDWQKEKILEIERKCLHQFVPRQT
jgi:hypothetical protein